MVVRFVLLCIISLSFNNTFASHEITATETVKKISKDYEERFFHFFPEEGLIEGKQEVDLDRFSDKSYDSLREWDKKQDAFLKQLSAIKVETITDPYQRITYALLKENLENQKSSRICQQALWNVNPLDGFHNMVGAYAERQPVGTPQYRQFALKRWRTFPTIVDNEINNLKLGLKKQYSAPKPAVKRVLNQVNILASMKVEDSPFYSMAKRDSNKRFKQKVRVLITNVINPSLKKYANFLEKSYLPKARKDVGVWALPNGVACYKAKIKQASTLDKSPHTIHTIGLENVKRLSSEIAEIGKKHYGTNSAAKTFEKANEGSVGYFVSEKEMLAYNQVALKKVKAKVIKWFDLMPISEGVIRPYPLHLAQNGAPGEYWPPSDDGKKPGVFYINTYEPKKRSRVDLEATLFHELIPGHHFQIALAYENKSLPSLNKYLWNSGFGEGWALYVERVADEMGLYRDDISRLGMLSNESLRASRLVVDTGIHAFHWTREQAVSYLKQHTAMDDFVTEAEVDRYIMNPGQATSYMLGKLEIESLRDEAKKRLGKRFNIREFHNQVLKNGTLTLSILNIQIQKWLSEQEGNAKAAIT